MNKRITIAFDVNKQANIIELSYDMIMDENVHTIYCEVTGEFKDIPNWLRLRRFELRSLISGDEYTPLFADNGERRSITAEQFIDKAYEEIMHREAYQLM